MQQIKEQHFTDTKRIVPVVTLSTQDNAKLIEKLKSGFNRTTNWNNYQPKVLTERPSQYLDFLIDPSFEDEEQRASVTQYYLPTEEIKNYNLGINGEKFLINQ